LIFFVKYAEALGCGTASHPEPGAAQEARVCQQKRGAWAVDDLLFVSNYGEGNERQISVTHFSKAQDGYNPQQGARWGPLEPIPTGLL
jgi:hypothetical protein